jgi:hypothetical protein
MQHVPAALATPVDIARLSSIAADRGDQGRDRRRDISRSARHRGRARLAIVGCSEAEIATITGHSLRNVRSILDATIYIAMRRWAKAQSGSSKEGGEIE